MRGELHQNIRTTNLTIVQCSPRRRKRGRLLEYGWSVSLHTTTIRTRTVVDVFRTKIFSSRPRGGHSPWHGEQACFEKWPFFGGSTGSSTCVHANSSRSTENSSRGRNKFIPVVKTWFIPILTHQYPVLCILWYLSSTSDLQFPPHGGFFLINFLHILFSIIL